METFIARQAFFDKKGDTQGYYLVILDTEAEHEEEENRSSVLNLDGLVNHKQAIVNYAELMSHQEMILDYDCKNLMLELKPDELDQEAVIEHMGELRKLGFKFILSGWHECKDKLNNYLEYIDVVKFDILQFRNTELEQFVDQVRQAGKQLYANQIDSHIAFKLCQKLGFDLYQGTYICTPDESNKDKKIESGMRTMMLLNTLQDPEVTLEDVENAVSQDPRLAYKLLVTVNSPAYGLRRKVESIRESLVYIGLKQLKRWVSLVALSSVEGKPDELTNIAMVRARMCEIIAEQQNHEDPNSFFTTGLFSTLDALFDIPMEDLLEKINFENIIKDALLKHVGDHGKILNDVIQYEQASFADVNFSEEDYSRLMKAYLESVAWADEFSAAMRD